MVTIFLIFIAIGVQDVGDLKEKGRPRTLSKNEERQALLALYAECQAKQCHYLRNESCLYDLLFKRAVRKELGLSEDLYDRIQALKASNDREIRDRYDAAKQLNGQAMDVAAQFERRTRADELDGIRSMLTTEQLKRLRQLAFYSEIEMLGLDVSLTDGVLGREIRVHENQKSHLRDIVRRLNAKERGKSIELHEALHREVMALLNKEEREAAESLLGPYFDFNLGHWGIVRGVRAALAKKVGTGVPEKELQARIATEAEASNLRIDYQAEFSLKYQLVGYKQVQRDLRLTDEQIQAIAESDPLTIEVKKNQKLLERAELRFDEIITPSQQVRLDQIVQHLRIAGDGYAHYVTVDSIANRTGMTAERRKDLYDKISKFESEYEDRQHSVKKELYTESFRQLTPEQQANAREVLGEHFNAPHFLFAHMRDSVNYAE